jgi:MFS family permease
MLAATNAMVAEFSNLKNRSLCVTIMAAGYPMGAIVGGSIASLLLTEFHWRAIFIFGGAVTALSIPLVLALLPESVYFLEARRPKKALDKINAVLKRLGRQAVSALPDLTADTTPKAGLSTLFGPRLISITLILTLAYFFHIMTFYFILKWIPKIVVDMGFAAPLAGGVLVWANVGGAMGAVLLGILSQRFGVKGLVIGAMVLGAIMVAVFGRGQDDLQQLSLIAAIAGFCTNAGVVGLYALFAQGFPTEVRAGGTGFAIGVGRGGAALGPIIAGLLFEAGASLQLVAIIMGSGSLMAAIALLFLRLNRTPDAVLSDADKSAA